MQRIEREEKERESETEQANTSEVHIVGQWVSGSIQLCVCVCVRMTI